jgi:hypothetical protein
MAEVFVPKTPTPDDGWGGFDFDAQGNLVRPSQAWPAYSSETGLPADQEVDAHGNPIGTEYDASGQPIFPLR